MIYVDYHCHWTRERCHMVADSHDELARMAYRLKVPFDSIQYLGTDDEHFDITMEERSRAIAFGATALSNERLHQMVKSRPRAKKGR
jgi:hypothetical protein